MRRALDEMTISEAFEGLRADYAAAKSSRFRKPLTGTNLMGATGDYHVRYDGDYLRIMEYARMLDRNDCVISQGVDRLVNNIFQGGFRYEPQTGHDEANAILKDKVEEWAEDMDLCDAAGRQSLNRKAKLAFRHTVVDGDVLHILLSSGQVQSLEGHRLRSPTRNRRKNVVHGVVMDDRRSALEYLITKEPIDPTASVKWDELEAYPAKDAEGFPVVLHTFNPRRISQTRGISAMVPIVDPVSMHDDLQFGQLVKAITSSCFAIFHEFDALLGGNRTGQTGPETQETIDGYVRRVQGIAPGMRIYGKPGEKLHGFSPNVPNTEFFPHAMLVLRIIALNLGMPLIMFLLDASDTNFSGWRGAIDQARIGFRDIQEWMVDGFYRPLGWWKMRELYRSDEVLRKLLAAGQIPKPYAHLWNPPSWAYIEPLKDAEADRMRLGTMTTSPRRLLAERNLKWSDVVVETVADNALAIRTAIAEALAIRQAYPDSGVTWRDVLRLVDASTAKLDSGQDRAKSEERDAGGKRPPGNGDDRFS
jgi:capsid protein